jgi:Bacterial extracellular solute-binding protein/ABC transporter substrate binding protein
MSSAPSPRWAGGSNGGLIVLAAGLPIEQRDLIIALAARHRLPAVYSERLMVTRGGLISYDTDIFDLYRQAAGYVDLIFKGAKPADLPVQSPTKYEVYHPGNAVGYRRSGDRIGISQRKKLWPPMQAEAAIDKRIVAEYGSARGNLKDAILKGQDFEVAILLPDVVDEIQAAGRIALGRFEVARVPVAFGLRGETPNLDVSSPAAVKAALSNAKSVKYSPTGAALMTVKKILSTLDIANKIHDSSIMRGEVPLATGEYEINIYPLSEIIPNKTIKNLGAVTAQLQVPVIVEATVGRNAADPKVARDLIRFLQGPAIDRALKDDGMEKGHIGK